MSYSSLAVHCTSLCCDIMQDANFPSLTHDEINRFYDDIYGLVRERTGLWSDKYANEHEFICSVTLGIIKAQHICKNSTEARDPSWLLAAMQSRIHSTCKRISKTAKRST
ncbi:hypothetical protein [Vibrio rarus]|uniref:hypothetical protein n=1 Tax=Vibrio rarus TaxID=413403 RepID=UPI0021C32D98|nr:hypothetical protein [Vibrio rarus]